MSATPPNILLITTDQQRFDALQCVGRLPVWTPHLDWLADNGIRFTNAYSDCPVCLPARVTLMTGRHAYHHGVMSNKFHPAAADERTTLPGLLAAAGYHTRLIGKQHFSADRRNLMGFHHIEETGDYFRFMRQYPQLGMPSQTGLGANEHAPGIDTVDETRCLTRWVVDRSIDFFETSDPSKPFFLWASFEEPHPPLDPCRSYWDLYRDVDVPPAAYGNWSEGIDDIPLPWLGVTRELSMIHRLSPAQLAHSRRAYYALVTQVDYHLGLLFGRLRELNLLQNTWIIFTSDHGEMLGDHHMGGKCVPFEPSAHVPMIIRPPHAARDTRHSWRGAACDALVSLADVLPTCCNLAGVKLPESAECDGVDLLAASRGEGQRERLLGTCMYLHYLREGRFKYCRETLSNTELLFDLEADPLERNDLLRTSQAPADIARFRRIMDEHIAALPTAVNDPGVAKDADHLPQNVYPGHRSPWGRV